MNIDQWSIKRRKSSETENVKHAKRRKEREIRGSRFIEDRSVSQLLLCIIEETGQVDTDSSKQSGFQQQPL